MITSPQNEKLKLVRKLADAKHREREGLFATEGEDLLLAAGLASRAATPAPFWWPRAPASRARRSSASCSTASRPSVPARGRSRLGARLGAGRERPLRLPARGRRPGQRRRGDPLGRRAHRRHAWSSGPARPIRTRRRPFAPAWAPSSASGLLRGQVADTPAPAPGARRPRRALLRTPHRPPPCASDRSATACPHEVVAVCEASWTIPLRDRRRRVAQRRRCGGHRAAADIVARARRGDHQLMLDEVAKLRSRRRGRDRGRGRRRRARGAARAAAGPQV